MRNNFNHFVWQSALFSQLNQIMFSEIISVCPFRAYFPQNGKGLIAEAQRVTFPIYLSTFFLFPCFSNYLPFLFYPLNLASASKDDDKK